MRGLSGFIFWFSYQSASASHIICVDYQTFFSQLIVAPDNFHLSQRFYKFRSTAPLALSEILLIIFGGLLYQCQELWKCKITARTPQCVIKHLLTTERTLLFVALNMVCCSYRGCDLQEPVIWGICLLPLISSHHIFVFKCSFQQWGKTF